MHKLQTGLYHVYKAEGAPQLVHCCERIVGGTPTLGIVEIPDGFDEFMPATDIPEDWRIVPVSMVEDDKAAMNATKAATWEHIHIVQTYLIRAISELQQRIVTHDQSKLAPPELDTFTIYTPKLKETEYGSDEYKSFLAEMKTALDNHYANNSHHPEHFAEGLNGMSLIDVLEMVCDWKASTLRVKNGDFEKSIQVGMERFGVGEQLAQLMRNTLHIIEGTPDTRERTHADSP
jgi:hypothetical protein